MGVLTRWPMVVLGLLVAGCANTDIPDIAGNNYVSITSNGGLLAFRTYWRVSEGDEILNISDEVGRINDKRITRHLSGSYQRVADILIENEFEKLNSFCVSGSNRSRQVFFPPDTPNIVLEWHTSERTVIYQWLHCSAEASITAEYVDAFEGIVEEILDVGN